MCGSVIDTFATNYAIVHFGCVSSLLAVCFRARSSRPLVKGNATHSKMADQKIRDKMKGDRADEVATHYDPMSSTKSSKAPTKPQTAHQKELDTLRASSCASMKARLDKSPAYDPFGSVDKLNFGPATIGGAELVDVCGAEAAKFCSQGISGAVAQAGASMEVATAIQDCQMTSMTTACGQADRFDSNPKSSMFNQRLFGKLPEACYVKCKEMCEEGQSSVLGGSFAQRTGSNCTLGDLRAGRCKNWPDP